MTGEKQGGSARRAMRRTDWHGWRKRARQAEAEIGLRRHNRGPGLGNGARAEGVAARVRRTGTRHAGRAHRTRRGHGGLLRTYGTCARTACNRDAAGIRADSGNRSGSSQKAGRGERHEQGPCVCPLRHSPIVPRQKAKPVRDLTSLAQGSSLRIQRWRRSSTNHSRSVGQNGGRGPLLQDRTLQPTKANQGQPGLDNWITGKL